MSQLISVALTCANIGLLSALFAVYLRNYMHLKTGFTLGLTLFAGIFLVRDIWLAYYHLTNIGFYYTQYAIDDVLINSAQLLAFMILLKITWK